MLTRVIPLNLQLCKLRRIRETDWDMEDVLPVSFAPLMNCKENMKAPPRFIEIRKLSRTIFSYLFRVANHQL